MNLDVIKAALLTIGVPVSHYRAAKKPDHYIVWAEDGEAAASWADNRMQRQGIEGTVDYFTKAEDDSNAEAIQNALNGVCTWRLSSIQHEEDTGYIHYEWVWALWLG
jgi:hypothetical protein